MVRLRCIFNELGHSNALLGSLSVDDASIHVRLPILGLRRLLLHDWRLRLSCLLFLLESLVASTVRFRTKPIVVSKQLILCLLHIVTTASVNALTVVIVLGSILIRIIGAISLLGHTLLVVVISRYNIVSLLLHLLVQFMKS